ncbi:MAG: hypothetical protein FJ112_10155 [Deltaproteobacteria bacterium]|nr:hypothetical protein [Deltaproteobacteria bacterium]
MAYREYLGLIALIISLPVHATEFREPLIVRDSSSRMLCTTVTQAQSVRFDRCRTNEVMTGVKSLDPIMVYCTTILANCLNRNSIDENKDLVSSSQPKTQ